MGTIPICIKGFEMQKTSRFLDPNSEMIALASYSNTKNLLVTAIEIKGSVDEGLLRPCVIGALEGFPQLRSCLKEIRKTGRHHLYWHPNPDVEFPVSVSDLKDHEASTPIFDAVLSHLAPRLDRDWDLFEELPGEVHFVRISQDHRIAVVVTHHAVFDAATASEFGRQCVLQYRELLTGIREDFPGLKTHGLSTSRKRTVKIRKGKWDDMINSARLAVRPLIWKPALPSGTGIPKDQKQYHIKRLFTVEETARLVMSTQKRGQALIDLLAAASNLAIDRWNKRRNVETGTVTTALTVNIRDRYQSLDHSNNVSAFFFESNSNDRKDPKQLVRSLATSRIRQLRKQMDLTEHKNVARMIACASLLPFEVRRKIVHYITQKHQYSIAITLLGVVWPVMKNGKPTFDSYPTDVRDSRISEIHGTGYKHLTSTPLVLIVYSFLKRLNLVLAASASLFTREEAEAFMDLFMYVLREDI
ncbi:MAG: hypothetical protein WCG29_12185 [Desulfomonile sp.]